MQRIFCSRSYVTFDSKLLINTDRLFKLVQKVCSMSMEAAKKAAGYTAIDRHVKVSDISAHDSPLKLPLAVACRKTLVSILMHLTPPPRTTWGEQLICL